MCGTGSEWWAFASRVLCFGLRSHWLYLLANLNNILSIYVHLVLANISYCIYVVYFKLFLAFFTVKFHWNKWIGIPVKAQLFELFFMYITFNSTTTKLIPKLLSWANNSTVGRQPKLSLLQRIKIGEIFSLKS